MTDKLGLTITPSGLPGFVNVTLRNWRQNPAATLAVGKVLEKTYKLSERVLYRQFPQPEQLRDAGAPLTIRLKTNLPSAAVERSIVRRLERVASTSRNAAKFDNDAKVL